jgi:hypothetical protein
MKSDYAPFRRGAHTRQTRQDGRADGSDGIVQTPIRTGLQNATKPVRTVQSLHGTPCPLEWARLGMQMTIDITDSIMPLAIASAFAVLG